MSEPRRSAKAKDALLGDEERLSLQRAFETFQRQSEMLERSHEELKSKLKETQLDLAAKNRQLAMSVEELAATKEKLSGIFESVSDALFLLDSKGRVDVSNQAGKLFLDFCGAAGTKRLDAIPELVQALSRGEGLRNEILEFKSSSGRRRYMLSTTQVKGGGAGTLLAIKDVTELMELQERVGREDRMAALGRVAASVAHEIRNPLGAIEGFGMLLERDLKSQPDLQRLASKTVYAARQLNSVVSNLLSYTRELRVERAPCMLAPLLEEAMEFIRPMAADRKVELLLGQSSDPSLQASMDRRQMVQVFINILMNAVEAVPQRGGGRVEVSWGSPTKGSLLIELADNGPGVPACLKKRIFEPFFTNKDGGTGLGLSLCQRIVEAHGGEISENGEEGQGARFSIRFDAMEALP